MKIGEFAQAAGLPISALRHYDKEGLLNPDFIDTFTGYRHYSLSQLERVRRITLLKQTGLSLKEIKEILDGPDNLQFILKVLDDQRARYLSMLTAIEEVKQIMLNNKENTQMSFQTAKTDKEQDGQVLIEREGEDTLFKSMPFTPSEDGSLLINAQELLDAEVRKRDYQRVSGFMTYGGEDSDAIQVAARVIPLGAIERKLMEDIDLPFVNDEAVIGRWRVVGEYAVEEDFFADVSLKASTTIREGGLGDKNKEIYFLPGGQSYWVYSWTKGCLKLETGDEKWLSHYHVKEYQGRVYMFLEHKSYEYRRGGIPTTLVLEQLDHKAYTNAEISRTDNVDIPYVRDERVLGDWKAVDFLLSKEDFSPSESHRPLDSLYFKHMHFGEDGEITSLYGSEIISGKTKQSWTKGYVLRYWNKTACAYEIVTVDNVDYMIIEWKSGDYRWGGFDTDYYVFVKES